jgi:hypothetical protein
MYGVKIQGICEAWEAIGFVRGRLYNKTLAVPRIMTNDKAQIDLREDSRRGKI